MDKTPYIRFSAKDLCTRSCMQLKMFRERPELKPKPNVAQWQGCDFQHNLTKALDNVIGEEMGNCLQHNNLLIYFANDIVTTGHIFEVKNITNYDATKDEWFLKSSLAQCAVYKTLTHFCKNKLKTAVFHVQNGNKYTECVVGDYTHYILVFGTKRFEIVVHNYDAIRNFILAKATHSLNWDTAKAFDLKYKGQEFEILKQYFSFKEID